MHDAGFQDTPDAAGVKCPVFAWTRSLIGFPNCDIELLRRGHTGAAMGSLDSGTTVRLRLQVAG